jgi:manganese/zinc/iron transport system ATP- binding protein
MSTVPNMPPLPALSVRGLTVSYGPHRAITGCDLDVPHGVIAGILGPNGSGKTTLLRACLGLLAADCGEIRFSGMPLAACRRRIAYMPQRESVDWDFPISALDVVAMGAHARTGWLGMRTRQARRIAHESLAQVGMEALAPRPVGALSGGQQQRVFLARALAQDASTYIMDEPLASVDAASALVVMDALRQLRARGRTIIMVHHDLEIARGLFDFAVLMAGQVIAAGPVDRVMTGDNLRAAYGGRAMAAGGVPSRETGHARA